MGNAATGEQAASEHLKWRRVLAASVSALLVLALVAAATVANPTQTAGEELATDTAEELIPLSAFVDSAQPISIRSIEASEGPRQVAIAADSGEGQAIIAEISQRAFVEATLDISEAIHSDILRATQPNLNSLQLGAPGDRASLDLEAIEEVEKSNQALDAGARPLPGATGLLRLLVSFPSRSELDRVEAWKAQHAWLLMSALEESGTCVSQAGVDPSGQDDSAPTCVQLAAKLTPSFEAPQLNDYERYAPRRTAGTHISPSIYLTALYELGIWRPATHHPGAADVIRRVVAETRRRSAHTSLDCDVSSLWVAAAMEADLPLVGGMNYGILYVGYQTYDLLAMAQAAAWRGCQRAFSPTQQIHTPYPFWDTYDRTQISRSLSSGIEDVLSSWTRFDPDNPAPWRACDSKIGITPKSETVEIYGLNLQPCLATSYKAMVDAAKADGVYMNGGGWRSTARQVALRIQHCNLPSRRNASFRVNLSLAPSSDCTPPVAAPGTSRHEAGLAVDFVCGRTELIGRGRCFRWLAKNAHNYGLYNFAAESWHWSIDGR